MPVQGNLVPNWSMEDWSGVPANPDNWTATRVNGGGLATIEEDNVNYAFHTASCRLASTDAGGSATIITTAAIPIDHLRRYRLSFRRLRTSGTLSVTVNEYDAGGGLIGAVATQNYSTATSRWTREYLYINPTGGGGNAWNANAVSARVQFQVSGVGNNRIDGIVFAPAVPAASAAFGTMLFWNGVEVAELQTIGLSMSADAIEVTSHQSADGAGDMFREFISGLKDGGEVTLEGNWIPDDAAQLAMRNDYLAGVPRTAHIFWPCGVADAEINAFLTRLEPTAPHDSRLSFSATLKIDGKPDIV